jgi:hypothetical protein
MHFGVNVQRGFGFCRVGPFKNERDAATAIVNINNYAQYLASNWNRLPNPLLEYVRWKEQCNKVLESKKKELEKKRT